MFYMTTICNISQLFLDLKKFGSKMVRKYVLYIANRLSWKAFRIELCFAGILLRLDVSLVYIAKAYCTGYFTGKVLRLPINP